MDQGGISIVSPRRSLAAACLAVLAAACNHTAAPQQAPAPLPQPAVAEEAPRLTLAEARALRATDPARFEKAILELTRSGDPETARRAEAVLALAHFEQKRWEDAAVSLARAAEANPAIASTLRLKLIEAESRRGNAAAAAGIATRILATDPASAAATIARIGLPALYARAGDAASADAALRQVLATPIDELTESEFVELAGALESAGRHDLATAVRMRLLTDYPQGRFTEKTFGAIAALPDSPLETLSYENLLSIAQRLGANARYDQAFDVFSRIARRFPDAATADTLRAIRLRSLFNARRYAEVIRESEGPPPTAAMALLRARAAWRDDQRQLFLTGLAEVEARWPSSREALEAKILRAKYHTTDEVNYPRAIENLRSAIAAGHLGQEGENLWTLGWTYILAGQPVAAMGTLEEYVRRYPDGDYTSNSLFWAGKLLDREGRREERDARWSALIATYPFSYFSYRARELAAASGSRAVSELPEVSPSSPQFPDLEAELALAAEGRLAGIRELIDLGLFRDASREMKRIAADHPDNLGIQFLLADVYVQGGEPFKANGILQRRFRDFVRHGGRGIPRRFWEILFPLNYWPAIRAAGERQNVDPYLLASIIRQESGFEPTTVSNAGAVGLMQIMPAEAERIGQAAGIEGLTRERLFDPTVNIEVGAAEYVQKLRLMNGNPILAIAAYNAGPEAVGRWLALTPVDDIDLFVEAIPFAETRLYVKTVIRNRSEYRRIYEARNTAASP